MKKTYYRRSIVLLLVACFIVLIPGFSDAGAEGNAVHDEIPAEINALDITDTEKQELLRAFQFGLPIDKLAQETVSGAEMAELLDIFISFTEPDNLDEWQQTYPCLRTDTNSMTRFNAMAAIFLSSRFAGSDYDLTTQYSNEFAASLNHSWEEDYLTWDLFNGWHEEDLYNIGGVNNAYLDYAAYSYNLGRPSLFSGEYPFAYDEESNTLRVKDPVTYLEAVLAIIRLVDSTAEVLREEIDLEQIQDAVNLGLVDTSVSACTDENCTRGELTDIFQRIHQLRYGHASKYLNDAKSILPDTDATRLWFSTLLYHSAMEETLEGEYTDLRQWMSYCKYNETVLSSPDATLVSEKLDGSVGEAGIWEVCQDAFMMDLQQPGLEDCDCNYEMAANYALCAADLRNGDKVLGLSGSDLFHPNAVMTVGEAIQAALRYYYSIEASAEPVSYADTYSYDSSIITPELLAKSTDLPDADCGNLPAEWHGVLVYQGRVTHQALDVMPDKLVHKKEILAFKEAGCNFIGLTFDFSRLQGPDYVDGTLNETRLKELDRIISWCIEQDIHVDLRCCGVGGLTESSSFNEWQDRNHDMPVSSEYAAEFAALWKALAQRYAGISNCYLSFNLLIEPEINSDKQYALFFGPAVTAIREADPDRCIIADIHSGGLTGKSMAEMGVALSYHAYDPREFCALSLENQDDPLYLSAGEWPYTASDGRLYDAAAVLDTPIQNSVSANELAAIAKEYGVGFMIGEWGIFGSGYCRNRYSDETIQAYQTDMANAMKEAGYGWCYGGFNGTYGFLCYAPCVDGAEYESVEGANFMYDTFMLNLFQTINGRE